MAVRKPADRRERAAAGVRVRARPAAGEGGPATTEVEAGLVVDAGFGYASRLYEVPAGFLADWRLLVLQARPPGNPRGGVLFPLEGGRWLVTLAAAGADRPPTDEAGFLAFAASLRSPLLAEAIAGAAPLSPVFGYRRMENRWRRFERLGRLPAGFLVTGNAAVALNPAYGPVRVTIPVPS